MRTLITALYNTRFDKKYIRLYISLFFHFDSEYYRYSNSDLANIDDFLHHYIMKGWREGRNPTAWFTTSGYLEANPDVKMAGINPFYHYIVHGRRERRAPFPTAYGLLPAERVPDAKISVATFSSGTAEEVKKSLMDAGVYSPQLLNAFSVSDYRLACNLTMESKDDYLVHFSTRGFKELLPISFDRYFDHSFYSEYFNLPHSVSPVEAYRHWLAQGLPRNHVANKNQLLKQLRISSGYSDKSYDDELYRFCNEDLPGSLTNTWLRLEHFVLRGAAEGRPGCPITEDSACLYLAAGDNEAAQGRDTQAQGLYEQVLIQIPNHPKALNHLGDCLLRQGQLASAAAVYRRRLEIGPGNIFVYLNLATCMYGLGAFGECQEALDAGIANFPEDLGLRMRRREWLARGYEQTMRLATGYAMAGRRFDTGRVVDEAETKLAQAWETDGKAAPRANKIEKVAIVGDHSLPQCRLYRIEQKVEQFAAAGISAETFKFIEDVDAFAGRLHEFDAVIFYRTPGWNETFELISMARQLGIPTFYETDDLIFDLDFFPEDYESYSGLVPPKEYANLITGAPSYRAAMQACDYAIATTAPLAAHMQNHVRKRKAFLHRNALGQAHRAAVQANRKRRPSQRVSLFFGSGTKAHKRDFVELLAPALVRLFAKYGGRIRLNLTGFHELPPMLSRFGQYVQISAPVWNVAQYWKELACCDINLAVLARSEATDCKSEIKWMEAAMFSIPSVVSRTANYEDTIEPEVTGFLAETVDEWFAALDRLIAAPALRRQVGAAAREAAIARYSEMAMSRNLSAILEEVAADRPPTPERKRILVVNVFYPPQAIGGATRVVHDNVRDLTERHGQDFDIEVFATSMGDPQPYRVRSYAHEGVRVTTVSTPSDPEIDSRTIDPRMEGIFTGFLASCKPDLIHFHCIQRLTTSLTTAARGLGIPYVVTVHDGWWISERQFLTDELGRIQLYSPDKQSNLKVYGEAGAERAQHLRKALSGAKHVLAVSASFAEIYRRAAFDNVLASPNGVSALPQVRRVASPDGRVRLGYLGGLAHYKGYPLIRAAFGRRRYPNLSLTIVDHSQGHGEERFEQWGETPVRFIGKTPQAEVGTLYGALDALLAPSVWPESYGLVTREALSCGLWVIASNRGAVGEDILEGENGFLIEVDSSAALENALAAINAEPEKYLVSPTRKVHLRRSTDQADDLAHLYHKLLGEGSGAISKTA